MNATLETFAPVPRQLTVAGRDFALVPLRMRQLPAFHKAVAPVVPLILEADYLRAATEHHAGMIEALTIATGADADWLGDLFPDQFLALMVTVIEVNLDFFARRLLPQVRQAAETVTRAATGRDGEPSSPGLSSADTD